MSIGEICNREVVIVNGQDSVLEAARLMRELHAGSVVAVETTDAPRPLGILTDRDLVVEVMAKGRDPTRVTVGEVMSTDLVSAEESEPEWQALARMRMRGVRRLPVVDARGMLVGIMSLDDLLEFVGEEVSDLVKAIKREQHREAESRVGSGTAG